MKLTRRWFERIFRGVPRGTEVPTPQLNLFRRLIIRKLAGTSHVTKIERNVETGAGQEVLPSVPPSYGPEEFAPGEAENEQALIGNLIGYLIPILSEIIDGDFSPAPVIKGARDTIASLRAIRRGEGPNEYGILVHAIGQATQAAPFGWRQSDLDRSAAMLIEFIRIQLSAKDEAPRDLSGKSFVELAYLGNDNVFQRHKGTPKVPAESGSLVTRGVGNREPKIHTILVKNGPRGKRGTVGVREAVRNTLGIKTPAGYHEIEVEVR